MKKNYEKPSMKGIRIQHNASILQASLTDIGGNGGMGFGGGKSGTARARGFDDWDDDCDEE